MAGAHVCAIRDSIFRPMFRCFSHCILDDLDAEASLNKRTAEIERAIQNGRAKLRPCLVIPNSLESARETNSGQRRICLMATFNDAAIAELPRMVRHFVVPVVTDSVGWDIKTFHPDSRIHTIPRWKHGKDNVKSQWVICFSYEVKETALLEWRGGYRLNAEQETRLFNLCTLKRDRWIARAESKTFRSTMLKSIMSEQDYAASSRCEDRNMFPSKMTIIEAGRSSASASNVQNAPTFETPAITYLTY
ncbi:hypothetical protein BT96DRAFT_1058810 [Gymnopus androsaceus JB14]|uniref:Uncharacterized protein n=1 Tax=Gymnopus androsaceus JB14 TaxID=1447944 RepID=A0A6A4H1R9_9AGAR|nr:hypothetical protein BT96DRAFT_1058810 [Gymnopus androsaceus JB14]